MTKALHQRVRVAKHQSRRRASGPHLPVLAAWLAISQSASLRALKMTGTPRLTRRGVRRRYPTRRGDPRLVTRGWFLKIRAQPRPTDGTGRQRHMTLGMGSWETY